MAHDTIHTISSLALALAMLGAGCQSTADGVGLLSGPPDRAIRLSSYQPIAPYAQEAPGILSRTAFAATTGAGYRVEVRDLLVGPRQKTGEVKLAGAAVFEVRGGNGLIVTADQRQEMRTGSTFSQPEGKSFRVENPGDTPITLRVHVFIAD